MKFLKKLHVTQAFAALCKLQKITADCHLSPLLLIKIEHAGTKIVDIKHILASFGVILTILTS